MIYAPAQLVSTASGVFCAVDGDIAKHTVVVYRDGHVFSPLYISVHLENLSFSFNMGSI